MVFGIFKKKKQKKEFKEEELFTLQDFLAPTALEIKPEYLKLGEKLARSFFIHSYPRYLSVGWLSPIINLNQSFDLSLYIVPLETSTVLKEISKKFTQIEAEMEEKEEKGIIIEPSLKFQHEELDVLREKLTAGLEKMFKLGVYMTVYGDSMEEIRETENILRTILEGKLIFIRPTLYQQKEGLLTSAPLFSDKIMQLFPMNTGPLSSTFPFVSFDLSSNEGILYGINLHNNSLILFDRFSLPNANMVVFATSGAGKSYMVKTEILRQLMTGVEVIVIDPENEYKALADAVGGSFINISLNSPHHLNPLDLPLPREDEKPEEVLRSNVINLVGLMRVMLGGMTPEEDAIMDRAITETYALRDITPETDPSTWKERIPLLSDLEAVLEGMEGAESLARRLKRYTRGTFARFFNQPTNVSLEKPLVVFGIRDMEEELRTVAMFLVLRHIWNVVRSELKKRILVVDEAWWMMKYEDAASFLFGLVKRARKYWLGVTTITQDVGDFMKSEYGKPIITNSSIQILLKQSPATIDIVQKTFNLTEEEKNLLLECQVGEGIFFAGQKHVLMKVVASPIEHQIITTSPEEILKIKAAKKKI
jgi:type IV secretory pathway VirB4 component